MTYIWALVVEVESVFANSALAILAGAHLIVYLCFTWHTICVKMSFLLIILINSKKVLHVFNIIAIINFPVIQRLWGGMIPCIGKLGI